MTGAVAFLAAALLFAGPVTAAADAGGPVRKSGSGFGLVKRGVFPKQSIAASVEPVRIYFRFRSDRRRHVAIRIERMGAGTTVRRMVTGRIAPGRWHRRLWDGRTGKGRLAPPGRYEVLAGRSGGPWLPVGRVRLHGHEFPVGAPHGTRGFIGEFGAPRVDGRTHEGFDITAACGSPLVAVRAGRILQAGFDPELYGNFVVLKGEGERRTYKYSHMNRPATVGKGQRVRAGHRLGSVGQTGNAASTPCHLHIEIRSRGRLLDPEPLVDSWDW